MRGHREGRGRDGGVDAQVRKADRSDGLDMTVETTVVGLELRLERRQRVRAWIIVELHRPHLALVHKIDHAP